MKATFQLMPPIPLSNTPYRVLARQYRPQKLSELVGQELLVKTLTLGIERNRLPHAFLLHGIRGVGKTTTARILAKALNCVGVDGQGGPTPDPCGVCESCTAIVEDRYLDVLEMDAASRTGVDDVREVIEASRYKAVKGRYKIYIIDEVHMLSKSAFNALLKTLEDPPPHVKFIFATTEIRKVPETVLSRCMRFDLNRIEPNVLFSHFQAIMAKEGVGFEEEALSLIVRAAGGSARDGLSLLDQAIALSGSTLTAETVRVMLGLTDRGRLFALLNGLLQGQIGEVLTQTREIYHHGGDTVILMEDLLDLVYWLTCLKTAPHLQHDITWPESDRRQGAELVKTLSLPALVRVWQVLHKGYEEVLRSPLPSQALEMVLVRIGYLSDLPHADELLAAVQGTPPRSLPSFSLQPAPIPDDSPGILGPEMGRDFQPSLASLTFGSTPKSGSSTREREDEKTTSDQRPDLQKIIGNGYTNPSSKPISEELSPSMPTSFPDLLEMLQRMREPILYNNIIQDIHLVTYAPGALTIRLASPMAQTLPSQLRQTLERVTGQPWVVDVVTDGGAPTIAQQKKAEHAEKVKVSQEHPLVQSLTQNFPGATVTIK